MFLRKKGKSRAQAETEVRFLGWWYQHFQLPSGVWTGDGEKPSYQPETRWRLIEPYVPKDLSGQTVLDVGGNAGYFSVQMKLRGAKRCVLVEPVEEFVQQARYVAREFQVKLELVNEDIHTYCLTTQDRFRPRPLSGHLLPPEIPSAGAGSARGNDQAKDVLPVASHRNPERGARAAS